MPATTKNGHGPGLGMLPTISGFPCNISAMNFKCAMQLGIAKAYHKITSRRKVGVAVC